MTVDVDQLTICRPQAATRSPRTKTPLTPSLRLMIFNFDIDGDTLSSVKVTSLRKVRQSEAERQRM